MSDNSLSIADFGSLMQIAEPEKKQTNKRAPGRSIGIDLGTTNSLVAVAPVGAQPRVLTDGDGKSLLPSIVSYAADQPLVGLQALDDCNHAATQVVRSVKRFMGRGVEEIDFRHPYKILKNESSSLIRFDLGDGREHTPVEISAEILRVLKRRAEAEFGEAVTGAVITVPAYFDDAQRQATKDAGRIAGLDVHRLLAEPTAAALAYGLDTGKSGVYAVYDLGGGTFDISILRLRQGVFQVLATGGDSELGGDDFDRTIIEHLLLASGCAEPNPEQWQALASVSKQIKETLTDEESTIVDIPSVGLTGVSVSRENFESWISPIVKRSLRACRQALKDADVDRDELDGVVMVGGSTRVPLVKLQAEKFFGCEPLSDIDPDRVVAYGAAIQADILSGSEREGVTLLDVVPLSLGLETMGGIVEKIIPRNATIPIAARQVFTNYSEKQTGMTVHVVQGERELANDCRSLAKFELKGIPQLPPSMARVEVVFELDADALLTVTAKELMTGVKQSVEVKSTYGLSEEEIDTLVMDSLDHAQDDFDARNVAEARVELGRVVLAIQSTLTEVLKVEGLVGADELAKIGSCIEAAKAGMSAESTSLDSGQIDTLRRDLEDVTAPLAQRRMERALNAGMAGKSLAEIEDVLAKDEAELDTKRGGHEAELVSDNSNE